MSLVFAVCFVGSGLCSEMNERNPTWCVCPSMCDLEMSKLGGLGLIWVVAPQEKKDCRNS
jgi:hypothetical protein